MFLAIISDTYADVRAKIDAEPEQLGLFGYLRRLFAKWCGMRIKKKKTADGKEPKDIRRTIETIRYTLGQYDSVYVRVVF